MTALSAEELSDLIGAIYDRAIDPDGWPETLGRIRLVLGAENAALSLIDLDKDAFLLNYFNNIPDALVANFAENQREVITLWGGAESILSFPLDRPAILSRLALPKSPNDSRYRDAFVASGFVDAMTLGLARDNRVVASCIFGRIRSAGLFTEAEIARATLILPHAQRAIAFSRMLDLATLRSAAVETVLDALALPTVIVGQQGEVIHANFAALKELESGTLLRFEGGRLRIGDIDRQAAFAKALTLAGNRGDADSHRLDVSLANGRRKLKLLPLPEGSTRCQVMPGATAVLFMTGAEARSQPHDRTHICTHLVRNHGLTQAECSVAIEIAKGDGRAAAAERLDISANTVRTHLSAIFLKLGINRQAQLVAAVEAIANEA